MRQKFSTIPPGPVDTWRAQSHCKAPSKSQPSVLIVAGNRWSSQRPRSSRQKCLEAGQQRLGKKIIVQTVAPKLEHDFVIADRRSVKKTIIVGKWRAGVSTYACQRHTYLVTTRKANFRKSKIKENCLAGLGMWERLGVVQDLNFELVATK